MNVEIERSISTLESYLGARYSKYTIHDTLGQSRTFLQHAGIKQTYTRDDLTTYLDSLVLRGYKARSIHTIVARLRTLFRANNWKWPLDKTDMHLGLPDDDQGGPVISPQDITTLIAGARELYFPDRHAVCLATVFGLRPNEIARVLTQGMSGESLIIQTAKGGKLRSHRIPESIKDVLTFRGRGIGSDGLHKCFERVMKRCVRDPRPGEGFHAVRRSVVTGLVNAGLSPYIVSRFMGWRIKETAFQYFRPASEHIDSEVYRLHPYLSLWSSL